jgi:hypothetical protein
MSVSIQAARGYATQVSEDIMTSKPQIGTEEAKRIGAALGLDSTQVDLEQFRIGLEVELEHGKWDPETNVTDDDMILTGKIALAHMREFPDYYTRRKTSLGMPYSLFPPSRKSLPALKNGNLFGSTAVFSPVLGFRPVYPPYSRTVRDPNPLISIRSPETSALDMVLKTMSTISSAFRMGRSISLLKALVRSDLFI